MLAKFERFTVNVCRVMIAFQTLCKLVSSHALTCLSSNGSYPEVLSCGTVYYLLC